MKTAWQLGEIPPSARPYFYFEISNLHGSA